MMSDIPRCPLGPGRPPRGSVPFVPVPWPRPRPPSRLPVLSVNGLVPDRDGDVSFAYVDSASYDPEYGDPPAPAILLKHGETVVAAVDASAFVIDGMVDDVEVTGGNLVITFNTAAGKRPISIPLTLFFDPDDYYTKTDVDGLLAGKASKSDATLTALTGFSDWALDVPDGYTVVAGPSFIPGLDPYAPPGTGEWRITVAGGIYGGGSDVDGDHLNEPNATEVVFGLAGGVAITAARTVLQGYRLGPDDPSNPNRDKPLASEAEAEALRAGKADKPATFDAGNLAKFDARGNPTDSGKKPGDFQSALSQTQLDNIAAVPNKQDALTFDATPTAGSSNPVTSGGIRSAIDAATPGDYAEVKAQVQANTGDIAGVKAVVPSAATAQNKLVDTAAMNSSIATNTANFLGTYSYVADLGFPQPSSAADVDDAAIATALGGLAFSQTPTNNDYVFVSVNYAPTTDVDEFRRFKFKETTGTWAYEYTLNHSSFTAAQWAAINSGITSGDVTKLAGIAAGAQVNVIEGVKVNGTALAPVNKVVDVVAMAADATGADIPVDASAGAQKISAALALKANDSAVVHTTGDETVGGVKTFDSGGVVVHDPQTGFSLKLLDTGIAVTNGPDTAYFYVPSLIGGGGTFALLSDVTGKADRDMSATPGNLAEFNSQGDPVDSGKALSDFALIGDIAPDWMATTEIGTVFVADQLCSFSGRAYRCILGYTFSGEEDTPSEDTTHWALATVEDVLAALRTALAGKEDASNKVTSLTAQSTDAQYPSAKCVYDALQGVDAKPTRIYNEAGTDALDDKGQLFKSTLVFSESYWTAAGAVWTYVGKSQLSTMSVQTYNWKHPSYNSYIAYDSNSGKMYNVRQPYAWESAELEGFEQTAGLNPSTDGVLSNMENVGLYYYDQNSGWGVHTTNATFTPYSETRTFSTYAHFSLESLPDRTWAAGVWAVGDLVKHNDKAYRCKAAATANDTTVPSSDTTHWTEIPVLSQKADRAANPTAGNLAALDSNGNPTDSGKSAADFMSADAKINELYNVNLSGMVDGDGQVFGSTTTGNTFNNGSTVCKFLDTETEYQVVGGVSTPFTKYRYKRDGADDIYYYRSYNGDFVAPNGYAQAVFTPGKNPIAGDVLVRTASYSGNWSFVPAEITMSTTPSDFLARVSDLAAFSPTKSYAAGDIAGYDGKVYKCTTAHTGAWDASHFTLATKAEVQAYLAGVVASIAGKANASDLRYTLPDAATTISSASSEVVSGETIYYGEATLADRTQNQVAVLVALDELRVTIPPAVSGKVRDFGLVVVVGWGEGTALAAPALVPVAPAGETITMVNAEGEMPTLADGTTTASGVTVLYFTQIGQGTFLVKGEQVEEVS